MAHPSLAHSQSSLKKVLEVPNNRIYNNNMMNKKNKTTKKNRKPSPNRLTCQISGESRMSNKTYLANKAEKFGVTANVWASFYLNNESYKELVNVIEENGFKMACDEYGVDSSKMSKWIKFNGGSCTK